ncbi:hypothetical protein EDB19DRAFT_2027951 [Suillus lakei]|nr:hypothetical protein EDB19DRAFT_2027951 [Suillus lakei]
MFALMNSSYGKVELEPLDPLSDVPTDEVGDGHSYHRAVARGRSVPATNRFISWNSTEDIAGYRAGFPKYTMVATLKPIQLTRLRHQSNPPFAYFSSKAFAFDPTHEVPRGAQEFKVGMPVNQIKYYPSTGEALSSHNHVLIYYMVIKSGFHTLMFMTFLTDALHTILGAVLTEKMYRPTTYGLHLDASTRRGPIPQNRACPVYAQGISRPAQNLTIKADLINVDVKFGPRYGSDRVLSRAGISRVRNLRSSPAPVGLLRHHAEQIHVSVKTNTGSGLSGQGGRSGKYVLRAVSQLKIYQTTVNDHWLHRSFKPASEH